MSGWGVENMHSIYHDVVIALIGWFTAYLPVVSFVVGMIVFERLAGRVGGVRNLFASLRRGGAAGDGAPSARVNR